MISKLIRFNGRMALKSKDLDLVAAVGIALICLLGNPTYADEEEYLTEEDMFFDVPVASGASRFPQALNKAPASVIRVAVDTAYYQCGKAPMISNLWKPEEWADIDHLPSTGTISAGFNKDTDVADYDAKLEQSLRDRMY